MVGLTDTRHKATKTHGRCVERAPRIISSPFNADEWQPAPNVLWLVAQGWLRTEAS